MTLSKQQLALVVLQDEGLSREQAALALVNDPQLVERLGAQIEAREQALEAEARARAEAAFAQTPEGRQQAALKLQAEQAEKAKLVAAARSLFEAEVGFAPDGIEDDVLLHRTGLRPDPSLMTPAERDVEVERFATEFPSLDVDTRLTRARELGLSVGDVERYISNFGSGPGSFAPTFDSSDSGEGGESA